MDDMEKIMQENKKALIVTTVSGFVPQFEMEHVRILQELGYEVHYASNFNNPHYGNDNHRLDGTGMIRHQVDFVRSPYQYRANKNAYRQLLGLMIENKFSLIHCHTPMGGVLARLAAETVRKIRKSGGEASAVVIYTAHGFHFYKGAPFKNWLLYYPAERLLAHFTDILITINKEDYQRSRKFHVRKKTAYIPGVGIKANFYKDGKRGQHLRKELSIPENAFVLVSVGELTKEKNLTLVLKSLKRRQRKQDDRQPDICYLICGTGNDRKCLERLIEKEGLQPYVKMLGYRNDIPTLLKTADCFVFPSVREGLPVAVMEAMASGLPVLCNQIRGNVDLIVNGKGGFLLHNKEKEYEQYLGRLINNPKLGKKMGAFNQKISLNFSAERVGMLMRKLYIEASQESAKE